MKNKVFLAFLATALLLPLFAYAQDDYSEQIPCMSLNPSVPVQQELPSQVSVEPSSNNPIITINQPDTIIKKLVPNPIVDPIQNPVQGEYYSLTGEAESGHLVYVRSEKGRIIASVLVGDQRIFKIRVPLKQGELHLFTVQTASQQGEFSYGVPIMIESAISKDQLTIAEQPEEIPFMDIQDHWAKDYIKLLYEKGIVNGKNQNLFDPDAPITRAELTKIALNTFGYLVDQQWRKQYFQDVPLYTWHNPYVGTAKRRNIVQGFVDHFYPDTPINRAAAIKVILEASGLYLGEEVSLFQDVPNDEWFSKYVAFAEHQKIVQGYEDGRFGPDRSITRAEVAKIVVKMLEL